LWLPKHHPPLPTMTETETTTANHGGAYTEDNIDDDFLEDDNDAMPDFESRAKEQQNRSLGFLEAFEASKEEMLQQGFESGYQQTFEESVKVGELLAEAVLEGKTKVVDRIRTFLETMDRSESKPSVTREDLQQLQDEIIRMKTDKV
jgi:flagellar biosynthesis/type III secretory pathway protein FliH